MSTEANKAIVRRYFDELASQGKLEVADELLAPTFNRAAWRHQAGDAIPDGPALAKFIWSTQRAAFPDWHVDIEDLLAEGDRVAARITAYGTHLGELTRASLTLVPPTGKGVSLSATIWFTVIGGRIAALEETADHTAFFQALGIRRVGEPDPEANKAVVRRIVDAVWNGANLAAIDELFAPQFTVHGQVLGPDGVRRLIQRLRQSFPDGAYTIEDLLAEGDRVVLRWTHTGTQQGELPSPLFGIVPPTGKVSTLRGVNIFRVAGGKAIEVWQVGDLVERYRQLGLGSAASPSG